MTTYPQCDVFGGAILPEFDGHPPTWPMPERCYTALYGQTPPYPEGEIAPSNVCGANMALRREVCAAGWRFGEAFLVGQHGLMGEDTDLVQRLAAAGRRVGFAPTAVVRHIIRGDQTSLLWMQRRFMRHGRTMFLLEEAATGRKLGYARYFPRWRIRAAASSGLRLLVSALRRDRGGVFEHLTAMAYHVGAMQQALALRAEAAAK
jgi:GT2 family glycosyltransferase